MARSYYSEFVQHCMRFYARHPKPNYFQKESDKKNWLSCRNALKDFSYHEKDLLLQVYREGDTIPDNVYQVAKRNNIKQDSLWKLIGDLEHKVAKRRGLIG